jgi:xanthine dehydrogenase molybdenum-binding subunit
MSGSGTGYKYIGKALPRRDGVDIVTGAVQYTDDLKFQNLLHGRVLRSPHAHAVITRIDTSKATALAGVKSVLTWQDIPDYRGGTPRNVRVLDKKVRAHFRADEQTVTRRPVHAREHGRI